MTVTAGRDGTDRSPDAPDLAARVVQLERENAVLLKGIQAYIAGDCKKPRSRSPFECAHGAPYYEECGACNYSHFLAVLADLGRSQASYGAAPVDEKVERERFADPCQWLRDSQRLLHDLRWWINHGKSETAIQAIDDYWRKWSSACAGESAQ